MTDNFDQLFKEKVDSKSYSYSAKAWHKFSKKAGFGGTSAAQIIAIATASTLVIALGGFFLYQKLHTTPALEPTPIAIPNTDSTLNAESIDTFCIAPQEISQPKEDIQITESKNIKTKPETSCTAVQNPVPSTDTIKKPEPEKKYILRPKNPRRILEINTDTIKSNE